MHEIYGTIYVITEDGKKLFIDQVIDTPYTAPVIGEKIEVGDTIYKNSNSDTLYLIKMGTGDILYFILSH